MKKAVHDIQGGDFRSAPRIAQTRQQVRQSKNIRCIALELVELGIGLEHPRRYGRRTDSPAQHVVGFPAAPFVLPAAAAMTRLVVSCTRWRGENSCMV